ncbi:hypothetical protein CEUSTIGMA_g2807.t1 [Chlamydomonas eustigma]|uniref:Uncharacterized protein n=1 Tax=Chlamydomonas eustigma TaxID=1157962 RepID=A0A250WWZ8_9CHLO|nr:hypothetical protein CEUSTIGMA_g2807.t1 [Chlamydomonas eustigma]|eukprot:GAX75363.1 hypothetical protein CEUSTIGMA_g2807.t1 [Chlamydomonas eustigma]
MREHSEPTSPGYSVGIRVTRERTMNPLTPNPFDSSRFFGSFWSSKNSVVHREGEDEEKGLLSSAQTSSSKNNEDMCPEANASLIATVFFTFANGLIKLGTEKHLEQEDLWPLMKHDRARDTFQLYQHHLQSTIDPVTAPQGVVWKTLSKKYGRTFFWSGVLKVFHDLIMFSTPLILEALLNHVSQPNAGKGVSVALAAAMFCAAVGDCLTSNAYFQILFRMSLQVKVDVIEMLYHKSLRITSGVKSDLGVGSIVNLQSNDGSKIWNMPQYLHVVWNGPFQILVVMGLLIRIMGWAATLAGLVVTVIMIPASTLIGRVINTSRKEMLKHTDARVKLSTEVVTGIKAIKLYAWEEAYVDRIGELRELELKQIRKTQMLTALNTALFMSGPVLVGMAAFGVYTVQGFPLTAEVAFPALSLFNLLRFPIIMFPTQITNLINAKVGLLRIQKFMEREEMKMPTSNSTSSMAKPVSHASSKALLLDPRAGVEALLKMENSFAPGSAGVVDIEKTAVRVRNGYFSWEVSKGPALKHLNINIKKGQLVMVVGKVGVGKSSLLHALLGEMVMSPNSIFSVKGTLAYTSQDPWIQNCTLRQNILMGLEFNTEMYSEVLSACALLPDLEVLPAGDASEIGEKGINLSGGQKHRVALARAVYAAADVYLLDDPLSAVDAHVGRHIFDHCICDLLGGTTRILVTHQLQYLPSADLVVVMDEGSIKDTGTYEQLLARGVDVSSMVKRAEEEEEEEAAAASERQQLGNTPLVSREASLPLAVPQKAVIEEVNDKASKEERLTRASLSEASSSEEDLMADIKILPVQQPQTSPVRTSIHNRTIGQEHEDVETQKLLPAVHKDGDEKKASLRGGVSEAERERLMKTLEMKEKDGKVTKAEERAKGRVQRNVYLTYLKSWSTFFYWVPITVLLMAFAERGLQIGQNFVLSIWSDAVSAAQVDDGSASVKLYLTLYFILGLLSISCQLIRAVMTITGSITASRSLNRQLLAKVVRLPMSFYDSQPTGRLLNRFTKDTEAIDLNVSGVVASALTTTVSAFMSLIVIVVVSPLSIVAVLPLGYIYYKVQGLYIASSRELKRLDSLAYSPIFQHFSETLHGLITIRAFGKQDFFREKNTIKVDESNRAWWPAQVVNRWLSVRLEMMGAAIVFSASFFVTVVITRSPGMVGLVITAALNLTGIMNWMVRQVTDLELNMNSVERVIEYEKLPEEAPAVIPERSPAISWPSEGSIVAENLQVRYRPELDLVLNNLSFTVKGMDKVGVCGRTGCGKSTLFMALYRIVEPCGGCILIDGVDITSIGLNDLRCRLSLVPQDPVIFSGTIRSNLDPFQQAPSDTAIWESLERAGMDGFVKQLQGGLNSSIQEGGANVSVGQRQLLCMARALLRKSKILVLDEATSNVDNATDALIQRTIRTAFEQCTVLTIAHRLHTIMDSDAILVLDAGQLMEYDAPKQLLKNPSSVFRKLVEETTRGGGLNSDVVARALHDATA